MSQPLDNPWIHIGECPVCVNGLCRVRTCVDATHTPHFYALCDECEAIWLQPDTASKYRFCDPESPLCPTCQQPLYGPQARWATPGDLQGTEWAANAIYVLPSDSFGNEPEQQDPRPDHEDNGN